MAELIPPTQAPVRNPWLDAGRALAFAAVWGEHAAASLGYTGQVLHHLGTAGVWLFFGLSGYLITRQLQALALAFPQQAEVFFVTFYVRRSARIFPLYYAFLLVACVFFPWARTWSPWFFASNWVLVEQPWPWGLGHLWTLALEEQFYLLWPGLFWLARNHLAGLIQALRRMLGIALLVSIVFLPERTWLLTGAPAAWALGLGAAWALGGSLWEFIISGTLALLFAPVELKPSLGAVILGTSAAGGLLTLSSRTSRTPPRWLTWLGERSYGLYLLHLPALALAGGLPHHGISLAIAVPSSLAATIGLAALLYRYWEQPWQRAAKTRFPTPAPQQLSM